MGYYLGKFLFKNRVQAFRAGKRYDPCSGSGRTHAGHSRGSGKSPRACHNKQSSHPVLIGPGLPFRYLSSHPFKSRFKDLFIPAIIFFWYSDIYDTYPAIIACSGKIDISYFLTSKCNGPVRSYRHARHITII